MTPEDEQLSRFRGNLDALIRADARTGIAVSGGPDSLALLLLAAAVRPSLVEAATVDHALREGSRAEAEMVSQVCASLGVQHTILTAAWETKPISAVQERARSERYRLLGDWANERRLDAIATAHHADDQAETMMMRLARGSGVRGLAGMRAASLVPGTDIPLLRPLLPWRRAELERICTAAGLEPARDPSNEDEQFERVRVRRALAGLCWLDPEALAASAGHLRQAESALEWAADQDWDRSVRESGTELRYDHSAAPAEIRRRIAARAVLSLATEGQGPLRGRELDRLITELASGRTATLRGVLCSGGETWRFVAAPNRTRRGDNLR
jgi:tRNA(Ile)-lysidine synthase